MDAPVIPSDYDAEVALLGSIFIDESIIIEVADILAIDDFYDIRNRLIYKAMVSLSRAGSSIDPTTVISELGRTNSLESAGGADYLATIADHEYSAANVDTYVNLIESAALKRNTISTLNKLSQMGYDGKQTAFDYIEEVEKSVFELSKRRRVDAFRTIGEVAKNVLENTEKNANRTTSDLIGLDTGYFTLNKYTQGLRPGALIILAARPAMGKTAFALNLAVNCATKNKNGHAHVAIFNLEMSAEQVVERILASESSIRLNNIMSGQIPKGDWPRFTTACSKMAEANIYFDDSNDNTIPAIRAKCRKLKAEADLDLIVIDYLQLIEGDASLKSQVEKVSKISRSLKLMARELEVPVVALSQLSRKTEERDDKHPILADLRDSGSIEQDADIVMFLYRDDYYNKNSERKGEVDLTIGKNRSGQTCENGMPFMFTKEFQKFKEKKDE